MRVRRSDAINSECPCVPSVLLAEASQRVAFYCALQEGYIADRCDACENSIRCTQGHCWLWLSQSKTRLQEIIEAKFICWKL